MLVAILAAASLARLTVAQVDMELDRDVPGWVSYAAHHPLHSAEGVSRSVTGLARLQDDGQVQVEVRVRLDSFESGNASLDRALVETLHGLSHPTVDVKALILSHAKLPPPATVPGEAEAAVVEQVPASYRVRLNGQERDLQGAVWLRHTDAARVAAEGDLEVTLSDYGLPAPHYLLFPVEDRVRVHFALAWRQPAANGLQAAR